MYRDLEELLQALSKVGNLTDPEFYGRFPVRTDIEILGPDKPKTIAMRSLFIVSCRGKMSKRSRLLGWSVSETIGIAVINPRCLSKLTKTSVVIE